MKKFVSIALAVLLVLTFCSCGKKQESGTNNEKSDGMKEISWLNYNVGPVANLIGVHFIDEKGKIVEANDKQNIAKIAVEPLCPYCHCDRWMETIEFEELPIEELGNQTVLFETTAECLDWHKHWDTSEFNISILLTLNK